MRFLLLFTVFVLMAATPSEPAKAAQNWLALVDRGKYGESWEQASAYFKKSLSKQQWIESVTGVRQQVGKFKTRKLDVTQPVKDPPNAPPGDYIVLQFTSDFSSKNAATETVILSHEPDKHWRISGYFVK